MMTIRDLKNPKFLEWLRTNYSMPLEPDKCDMEEERKEHPEISIHDSNSVLAEAYRRAECRKLVRLYKKWALNQD
jgi:hypothetical protein